MRVSLILAGVAALAAFLALRAPLFDGAEPDLGPEEIERVLKHSPLGPPPPDPTNAFADHPGAARLGQRIFYDARFSRDGKVSCSTCHDPAKGFADGAALSAGFELDRHVPTLWNVAHQRWFFWDGRADSLWSQALRPFENPREHGTSRARILALLKTDARLRGEYEAVFGPAGEDVDRAFANVGKAVAAFERRLTGGRSAFDVFVEGLRAGDPAKTAALAPGARKGLKLFMGRGNCRLCHVGPAFSDGEFHDLGLVPSKGGPSAARHEGIRELLADPFNGKGRFSDAPAEGAKRLDVLARLPEAVGQWKTPSLRNVAKTAPYMHQGQFATLRDVVRFYSTLQPSLRGAHADSPLLAPLRLDTDEIEALVEFLEALTDVGVDPALLKPLE
jgi:cytochrome c peroxidase